MIVARLFVAVVFAGLAAAFIWPTYSLYEEFGAHWYALAAVYSQNFLFFPTIGIVALLAFYFPAVLFVDLYWRHVRWGSVRFTIGAFVTAAASVYIAGFLSGTPLIKLPTDEDAQAKPYVPAIWELAPATLAGDTGQPAGCVDNDTLCQRQPVYRSLDVMRQVSESRTGISAFARACTYDPLLEPPPEMSVLRYCFPLLRKADANTCCVAQQRYAKALETMYQDEPTPSKTHDVHIWTLPFKVFFMIIILAIGALLAVWRGRLDRHYPAYMSRLENGVLIGATAMLFWPATNQAFLQSIGVLFGPYSGSAYQDLLGNIFSAIFGLWALLILFFFFRHYEKDMELWVKSIGAAGSVIAVFKYDKIVDLAVRYTGSGSAESTFPILMGIGLLVYLSSFFWPERKRKGKKSVAATTPAIH